MRDGVDPLEERAAGKIRSKRLTFSEAIADCLDARQAQLKRDAAAGRWLSPLSVHVIPKIGDKAIEDVDQHVLKRLLEPIWHEKSDTARKAINRLNLTLKHAAALGLDVDLQAKMKARELLGEQRHEAAHVPSIPYPEASAFYAMLASKPQMCCLALRFLMLTVARTSEICFARREDVVDDVLIVPAERTKTGQEHRVPLAPEALEVIDAAAHRQRRTYFSRHRAVRRCPTLRWRDLWSERDTWRDPTAFEQPSEHGSRSRPTLPMKSKKPASATGSTQAACELTSGQVALSDGGNGS
ncbi:MAG: hypothetical protein AAF674_20755 [Pseudomonadota bacterium]